MCGCNKNVENAEGIKESVSNDQLEVSESEKSTSMKDVVFSNEIIIYLVDGTPIVHNDMLTKQYLSDSDTLYACSVKCINLPDDTGIEDLARVDGESDAMYEYRKRMCYANYMVELFLDEGLMVLENSPFCVYDNEELLTLVDNEEEFKKKILVGECVVVGTYEQLAEIFDDTDKINGGLFRVINAVRPDLLEAYAAHGYPYDVNSSAWEEEWVVSYSEEFKAAVGGDYCTLTVPVIVPEESGNTEAAENTIKIAQIEDKSEERPKKDVTDIADCEEAECFFEDEQYEYYFISSKSALITVTYEDGSSENIKDAFANGKADIYDLGENGIGCFIKEKNPAAGNAKSVIHIVDESDFADTAYEKLYEDIEYQYGFSCMKSNSVFVYYSDGTRENVKSALEENRIAIRDLDTYNIDYLKTEKATTGKSKPLAEQQLVVTQVVSPLEGLKVEASIEPVDEDGYPELKITLTNETDEDLGIYSNAFYCKIGKGWESRKPKDELAQQDAVEKIVNTSELSYNPWEQNELMEIEGLYCVEIIIQAEGSYQKNIVRIVWEQN